MPAAMILLLTLLAQDATAQTTPEPERVITNPDWAERPSGADAARLFPHRALEDRVSGRAVIGCRVTDDGRLEACRVEEEEPEGYGFGESALAMADRFRMTPGHGGARVNIPVAWNAPTEPPERVNLRIRLDRDDLIHCTGVAIARYDHEASDANRAHLLELVRYFEMFLQGPRSSARREVAAVRDTAAAQLVAGQEVLPCAIESDRELRLHRP